MIAALVMPPVLRAQIEAEARAAFPRECCGLIEGISESGAMRAVVLHAARNLSAEADRFEIDPSDHFSALRAARANGRALIGCYHSHPNGRAEPSALDMESEPEKGFVWVIAALASGRCSVSAFMAANNGFAPMDLRDKI